eukprot:356917-Chlamydomonas_euryale.AAC.18
MAHGSLHGAWKSAWRIEVCMAHGSLHGAHKSPAPRHTPQLYACCARMPCTHAMHAPARVYPRGPVLDGQSTAARTPPRLPHGTWRMAAWRVDAWHMAHGAWPHGAWRMAAWPHGAWPHGTWRIAHGRIAAWRMAAWRMAHGRMVAWRIRSGHKKERVHGAYAFPLDPKERPHGVPCPLRFNPQPFARMPSTHRRTYARDTACRMAK